MKYFLLVLIITINSLYAKEAERLVAGNEYYTLVRLNTRSSPSLKTEKDTVLPVLEKVVFTGKSEGELTTTLFDKEVTAPFVEIVYGSDTGWVFGAMIGDYWDYHKDIIRYIANVVPIGDSLHQVEGSLSNQFWVSEESEYYDGELDEFNCEKLWRWSFTNSKSLLISIKDGTVSNRSMRLSFGSRTSRSYTLDLDIYNRNPAVEERCTTMIDVGGYEVPDGCYLVGINEDN